MHSFTYYNTEIRYWINPSLAGDSINPRSPMYIEDVEFQGENANTMQYLWENDETFQEKIFNKCWEDYVESYYTI